jgi:hypoxanthine-DNA glycosylase
MGPMLEGLAPVIDADTRLVVLGSFPGVASLAAQQYYGHPRNLLWRLLSALWDEDLVALDYAQRLDALRRHGVGLWDVYRRCEREGSLDSAIRVAVPNDLARLTTLAPGLRAIVHNGGESARSRRLTGQLGVAVHTLPSTSPANASWSFERKLEAWHEVFSRYDLAPSTAAPSP